MAPPVCETYFINSANNFHDVLKDSSSDRAGLLTQKTYKIKETAEDGYTINLYNTKCSALINGKNIANFLNRDLNRLHDIVKKTTINGVTINIKQMNELLANQLHEVIQEFNNTPINQQLAIDTNKQTRQVEKCYKCNRNCKTRADQCINSHWVHFRCEKLSDKQREYIEQHEDGPYTCSQCY